MSLNKRQKTEESEWLAEGKKWVAWDPNDETRAEISQLVEEKDWQALKGKLSEPMEFGTSGLRAPMGSGVSCINELTIMQAAQGLCEYMTSHFGESVKERGIAIGYDHRRQGSLNSEKFALITACVMESKGIKSYLFNGVVATMLVPFCVKSRKCAAGVMVTASHNPKIDNGYKVYWENGSQIIPPHDIKIAASIKNSLEPWAQYDTSTIRKSSLVKDLTEELTTEYLGAMKKQFCRHFEANQKSELKIVYTPMHGVGHAFAEKAFELFGLPAYVPVAKQLHPDPDFPTVAFPNPEEGKGALALAMAAADESGASLIFANDPDADRFAACERLPAGGWRMFTGNELGVMFGHWQYIKHVESCKAKGVAVDTSKLAVVASTVSSKMLRAVAHKEGFRFDEVLTGFKWIGNQCAQLQSEGYETLFSYEESIGFCAGDLVNDKDGISAASIFGEMANHFHEHGSNAEGPTTTVAGTASSTVHEHMEKLYERYGRFVQRNSYFKCYKPEVTAKMFERLRNAGNYWHKCGDFKISEVRDLCDGYDSSQPGGVPILPVSKAAHMLTYTFANGCVATLRTSGTEPKIKYYIEMVAQPGQSAAAAQAEVDAIARSIIEEMLQPDANELERPPEDWMAESGSA
jgi:phosphomannomutase